MRNTASTIRLHGLRAGYLLLAIGLGLIVWSSTGVARAEERLVLEPYPAAPAWREVTHKNAGAKFLIEQFRQTKSSRTTATFSARSRFPNFAATIPPGSYKASSPAPPGIAKTCG